jgi:hypothetical protein
MQRNNRARFFPLIISLVVIALIIAAVISIGRAVFNGGDKSNTTDETSQTDKGKEALVNTSTGHSVQMTVRGPIVAEENFTSYRVSVSNSERSMNVYKGYVEEQTNGKTLDNNTQAYEQLVYALDKANMMKGNTSADDESKQDLRGICARGYVYEFAVLSGGNEVKKLWTSTCGGSKGTLDASKDQLSQLFLAQIPGSSELIPFRQSPVLSF